MPGYDGITAGVQGHKCLEYEGINVGVRGYKCRGTRVLVPGYEGGVRGRGTRAGYEGGVRGGRGTSAGYEGGVREYKGLERYVRVLVSV